MAPRQKPGRSKQDYQTPPEFLTAVKDYLRIDAFDIDLAASAENAVEVPYYTEADNALIQPWKVGNGWNWLNPPFAFIAPWVGRAWQQWLDHQVRTAVLVPASVGANWWRESVHYKATVLCLNGRITFVGETTPYPKDCALLLYGGHCPGYHVWDWRV